MKFFCDQSLPGGVSIKCGVGVYLFFFFKKGHPLFFFRLASNAFPDIGSVGRIEKKKR